jgi:hypothetical protein
VPLKPLATSEEPTAVDLALVLAAKAFRFSLSLKLMLRSHD